MGKRRNVEIAQRPEATRLTAATKLRIVKLHDTPFTPSEISREVRVSVDVVRQVLAEMCPVDVIYA
jgi:hypothetical protein